MSVPELPKAQSDTAIAAEDPCVADLTGLHPIIQEELDRLHPYRLLVQEPVSSPLKVQYAISDSFSIDETLARAESAVATVCSPGAGYLRRYGTIYPHPIIARTACRLAIYQSSRRHGTDGNAVFTLENTGKSSPRAGIRTRRLAA